MKLLILQAPGWGTPASEDIRANVEWLSDWADRELSASSADLVVLPELSTTPYFCCRKDDRYFAWAQSVPGPATYTFSEVARRYQTSIVLPLFERCADGRYYNSAAIIGPDGSLVQGSANGGNVSHYRKCHIPHIDNPPDTEAWEDYYFRAGSSLPVFNIGDAAIGVLICYDRWFPEAWRALAIAGAQVVIVPMVAWGFVEGPYLGMLQSRAVENGVFVASCNRSGTEVLDGIRMEHFGRSAVFGPSGQLIVAAPPGETQRAIRSTIDVREIEKQRHILPLLRDRRLDLYGGVTM